MANKFLGTIKKIDTVIACSVYLLVFLLPLAYLPQFSRDFDILKQLVIVVVVFSVMILWLIKIFLEKKVDLKISNINASAVLVLFSVSASCLFSINPRASFFGISEVFSSSVVTYMGIIIFCFLILPGMFKKDVIKSLYIFLSAVFIAQIILFLEIIGFLLDMPPVLSFFSFNTIGSPFNIAIFSASILPIFIVLMISHEKYKKLFFGIQIFFAIAVLAFINYQLAWFLCIIGSLATILFIFIKKDVFDTRWIILPLIILFFSLYAVLLNPYFRFFPNKINDVYLLKWESFKVAEGVLRERPVLGSGPGTFSYNFLKHGSVSSKSGLNGLSFNYGGSKFLTELSENGILGLIALLVFLNTVIMFCLKFLSRKIGKTKSSLREFYIISALFLFFICQSAAIFFYGFTLFMNFTYFFTAGLISFLCSRKNAEFVFDSNYKKILYLIVLLFVLAGGSILCFLEIRMVMAKFEYNKAKNYLFSGEIDEAAQAFKLSANINPGSAESFKMIAETNMLKIDKILKSEMPENSLSEQEKNSLHSIISDSVNAAKIATDLDENNSNNWIVRGHVYKNLVGFLDSSESWAKNCYLRALELDPGNTGIQKNIDELDSFENSSINNANNQ